MMITNFMLNGNLLRCCREWTRTELRLQQDRLRSGISYLLSLLSVITRSLSTIRSRHKQVAFVISQICLVICVFILIVNIPPILLEISNAEDIFDLSSMIITLIVYFALLGFLFVILIMAWYSVYQRYKQRIGYAGGWEIQSSKMGFTATPFRNYEDEDQRNAPEIKIWVEADRESMMNRLRELIQLLKLIDTEKTTLILCDSIKLGTSLDVSLGIPFVSGAIKSIEQRAEIIRNSKIVIITRAAFSGIMVTNLGAIIDIDFVFGSIREKLQNLGRLFSSRENCIYHILTNRDEYMNFQKRFKELYRQGIKVTIIEGDIDGE